MSELRYDPLSRRFVMMAAGRANRPALEPGACPFCPAPGGLEPYTVWRYPNDYPALSTAPSQPGPADAFFQAAPAYGRCEVLLYSPAHDARLAELPDENVHALAGLWREVYLDMAADEKLQYVFEFENRGALVGATMTHPHGQAYGYSFIPPEIQNRLESQQAYFQETGACLYCGLLEAEGRENRRIIFEHRGFTVFLPYFSPTAYGVHIAPRRHVAHLGGMTREELDALGETVRACAGMYDALFDQPLSYMMCLYNAPPRRESLAEAWHFHIQFFPALRAAGRQQFYASSETGAGAWCNPTAPEEKAAELRDAYRRYCG